MRGDIPIRLILAASIVLLPAAAGGCYRYEPVATPEPGMDVRARLSTEAAVRRSEGLDEPIMVMEGSVVRFGAGEILLDVLVARGASQFQNVEIRDTVLFSVDEIQSILQRKLSPGRTIAFTAAMGVGTYLVLRGITSIVGGNEGDPDPGNQTLVVPSFLTRRSSDVLRFTFPVR